MALDTRKEAAWKNAFEKGSKAMQKRLQQIHAKNPDFQEFMQKHGFGQTLSAKQAEMQKKSSVVTVPPADTDAPEKKKGPQDRLAAIKSAAEKAKLRRQAASSRTAWGGELGGGFVMPGSSFRRYSESLGEAYKRKVDKMGFPIVKNDTPAPASKTPHPVPAGYERIKDPWGFNVLRKKVTEHLELTKMIVENSEMSSKEALQELKKATYASYLQKAPQRIRSGTKIGIDFENDYYHHLGKSLKHSPNVMDYPPRQKDPEKLAHHEKQMKVNKDLADQFKKDARNRIKGIQRAGRLLAKEDIDDALNENNSLARPDLWDTHELRGEDGKAIKKGQVVKDFRGEPHKVVGFAPPHKEGSTGRVYTKHGDDFEHEGSFFPGVINASIHKKSSVKEAFVRLYKSKRDAKLVVESKQEVEETQEVIKEQPKQAPNYRQVREALIRRKK